MEMFIWAANSVGYGQISQNLIYTLAWLNADGKLFV